MLPPTPASSGLHNIAIYALQAARGVEEVRHASASTRTLCAMALALRLGLKPNPAR